MKQTSELLAISSGLAIGITKFLLNEPLWWPFVIPEYAVTFMLVAGALMSRVFGRVALLGGGWAATGMLSWTTLSHHLEPNGVWGVWGPIEIALAVQFLVSGLGMGITMRGER